MTQLYTGQKKLRPTCGFLTDLKQKKKSDKIISSYKNIQICFIIAFY